MFFSVVSPDWKPGQPMAPAGALLFRSKVEAEAFAPDARVVGVAVRHNSTTRVVTAQGTGDRWSSRAVGNALGGLTVFGSIPSSLVRDSAVPAEFDLDRVGLAPAESFGWDSLTMALLA